jgi:radical SAM protein with 4Fe4S-binding SPASM domain
LHASLELTRRCSIHCVHCYVLPNAKPPETELSTSDWLALAQEAVDAGCYSMLLTGGEPLLRKDFADIYLGIRNMGVHVTIFTNATRVDERIVEILRGAQPMVVEVTVYGATPETYRRVTGRAEFFDEAMRGIALMRKAGLQVRLKTVLMQDNRHDFEAICAMAAPGERPVRFDAVIQPRFPGDTEMLRLRVPPKEAVDLEFRTVPELAGQWRKLQNQYEKRTVKSEGTPLYTCAAGVISFYVTAQGMMQPCVTSSRYGLRYERGKLLETFRTMRQAVRTPQAPAGYACPTCKDRLFCGSCPPVAELETGDEANTCAYACAIAHERGRRLASEPES